MTCKDCIHWQACRNTAYEYAGEDAASAYDEDSCCKQFAEICENFSDKSEWVHLPCKVGDIVYCFAPCFDTDHYPRLEVVEREIVELKTIATVFGLNFDIDSIGKTIFLTREEAEKVLDKQRETLNGGKTDD